VKFFNDLDGETLHNYTHFGYAADGRKASASIFRDLRSNRLTGYVLLVDGMVVGFGHIDFFTKREKQHVVKLGIVLHPRFT
jgi:hypothetical protein